MVRGRIGEPISLKGLSDWVDAELERFGGNLICRDLFPRDAPPLKAVSVYSPAWEIDRKRLAHVDVSGMRLTTNPDVWLADILWASLRHHKLSPTERWIVGGDFNLSETFDQSNWSAGGNREYLDRMAALGLTECLRKARGALTPTFRTTAGRAVKHQIDHLFVTESLASRLVACDTGSRERVFEKELSDHLPVVADFEFDDSTLEEGRRSNKELKLTNLERIEGSQLNSSVRQQSGSGKRCKDVRNLFLSQRWKRTSPLAAPWS